MTRPWTVNLPSELVQLDDGLWCVTDVVPGIKGVDRRMAIVRREDGTLLFYNAIPLPDTQLAQVRALGEPAHLVLPNAFHTLDAHAFCARLGVTAFAPAPALQKVRESISDAQDIASLPKDNALEVVTIDGFKTHEACLLVKRSKATSWVVADVVCNAPHGSGLNGVVMRMVGFTADQPILPRPVRWRVGRDLQRVKEQLLKVADAPNLARLVPSHGAVVESDVPQTLRKIAQAL